MDATAWTVSGTGIAILAAIEAAFWSMRAPLIVLAGDHRVELAGGG